MSNPFGTSLLVVHQVDAIGPRNNYIEFAVPRVVTPAALIRQLLGNQDLFRTSGVLAQLACRVDLRPEHLVFANSQDVSIAQTDAQQYLFLGALALANPLTCVLHRNRAVQSRLGPPKECHYAVAFYLQKEAIVIVDDGSDQGVVLVDDLEKMNDAKVGYTSGEAR